jgi:Ser/Thr protein kinase RdoA (MazF antagonist)
LQQSHITARFGRSWLPFEPTRGVFGNAQGPGLVANFDRAKELMNSIGALLGRLEGVLDQRGGAHSDMERTQWSSQGPV